VNTTGCGTLGAQNDVGGSGWMSRPLDPDDPRGTQAQYTELAGASFS